MVATYGETLSREHAEKRRQILESEWYKRIFPHTKLAKTGGTLLRMKTSAGGGCRAVSVGGPVTGRGADIIILDDCMKSDEGTSEAARLQVKGWFSAALYSRLKQTSTFGSDQARARSKEAIQHHVALRSRR